ncbi:head GIN domain-containing protein [Sphingobium sp. HBC34]|uniref:Head GIN domain-containing protein n=1 Tax=Sphingobium cyanobacteriorum TaxID=3063954 RepID=A0ABT8ZR95_9SPHN|nr:head GIN domain-containing protein [Sphingobium sp. HBC34]MDO7837064.1 head GIN domain-containing protein [Sphingobium sp. HBC34]
MPRPLPLLALALSGLVLSTGACSRTDQSPAADATVQSPQNWTMLKDFDAIEATGPDDVSVTIGSAFSVRADGDAKAIGDLDIQVKGGKLLIGRKSKGDWNWGRKDGDKGATVHVTMPAITAADLTGAGDFSLDKATGDRLALSLTGAGDFHVGAVTLKMLEVDITGAGSVKIAGAAERAKLSITGAGDIDAEALKVSTADISIMGAGDIDIASDGQVAIDIMGPGDVTVKGKAQCTTKGMGPGEARCAP